MNTSRHSTITAVSLAALLVLGGCASMTQQEKNTAYGAGAGGVAGGLLTGGSALGVLGGAAVGGAIGHVVSDDDDK
jgi:osmotically inducible lipoprotein OsmB